MPSRAAQLSAATTAVGTASTSEHGHATTSIVTAMDMSWVNSSTVAASIRTTGVYQAA